MSTTTEVIAQAERSFKENILEHEMEILHDQGEHRHLRFRKPGTWWYGFDLITWPGYVASAGDVADGYMISGLHGIDPLEFLAEDQFDPHYWATKVQASRWPVKKYSEAKFHARANEYFQDSESPWTDRTPEENARFREEWEAHLANYDVSSHAIAVQAAVDFDVDGVYPMQEFYEHDLTELDFHFVLACFCIRHGIREYLAK